MNKIVLLLLGIAPFLSAETFTLHFLIPKDNCWIESGAAFVANNDGKLQAMTKDEVYPGWFSYSWDKANVPDSMLFYCNDDKTLAHPIGMNKIGADTIETIPAKILFELFKEEIEFANALYFIPDAEKYDVEFLSNNYSGSSVALDVRDPRPSCFYTPEREYNDPAPNDLRPKVDIFYSIVNAAGDTIQPEKEMTCNETEIANHCKKGNPVIKTQMLPPGEYKVIMRVVSEGTEYTYISNVTSTGENGTLDSRTINKKQPHFNVLSVGTQIQISSTSPSSFAIFNSKGQMVKNGYVNGSANITMFSAGNYWVKVGSESRLVRVFN
jgi:hypothetical protein